jgi:hypothetical protein
MNISGFALLLEFLENYWNFKNFFQGPGKLLEILFFDINSWKTPSRCNNY